MRNLTIKRAKRFVACLGTMKVYIEDPVGDTMINDCACRKLGTLKNGEEKTFQIGEEAAKVYVIADQLSKGFCSEFYPLPEGTEDILLTGKNHFNPAAGNPFRFDGVTDEAVLQNRKKGTGKGVVVLAVAIIVGLIVGGIVGTTLAGSILGSPEPETFSVDGMQITLTDQFDPFSAQGYNAGYEARNVGVLVLKESFSLMDGFENYTLADYGALVLQANGQTGQLKTENGVTYFEYQFTNPDNNITYHYITTLHKGPDAFWIVQFFTVASEADDYRQSIFDWAKTVTFTE